MLTLLKVISSLPHKASHFHGSFSIRWTDCSHSFVSVPTERVREGEKHEIYAAAFSGHLFTGRNEVVVKVMFLLVSVILSTGGCAIPACIAGGIPACLAAGRGGAWSRRVPAPGGCLVQGGAFWYGLLVWPSPRWLLLQMVCILLECILVYDLFLQAKVGPWPPHSPDPPLIIYRTTFYVNVLTGRHSLSLFCIQPKF